MTQYFVDNTGKYLGGFDGVEPPVGSIEVPFAPDDARQLWQNGAWQPYTPDYSAFDAAELNRALTEPGSIVRALALIMFDEINKLRVKGGDPAYTLNQFRNALVNKMRG